MCACCTSGFLISQVPGIVFNEISFTRNSEDMGPKPGTKKAKEFKTPFSQTMVPFSKAYQDSIKPRTDNANQESLSALTPRSSFYFPHSTSPINLGRLQKVTPGSKLKIKERFANGLGLQAQQGDTTSPGISISFVSQAQSDVGSTMSVDDHDDFVSQESEAMSEVTTQETVIYSNGKPSGVTGLSKSAFGKSHIAETNIQPTVRSTTKGRTHDLSIDGLDEVSFSADVEQVSDIPHTSSNHVLQRRGHTDKSDRSVVNPNVSGKKRRLYGTDMITKFDQADTASEISTDDYVLDFPATHKEITHKPTARKMSKLAFESAKQDVLKIIYKMHLEIEELQERRRALNTGCNTRRTELEDVSNTMAGASVSSKHIRATHRRGEE